VAIIDDGVDFSHPDLAARAWTNPGESGGGRETNGIDDDGNGYIDDVHGWDFCHNDKSVHDFGDDFHGTHVAGTIAASLNGSGVVGVAPSVSIMALKFISDDPDCGLDSQAIAAIEYAKSFGVHIVNASWGAHGDVHAAPELYSAIKSSGMLFVAAAGNEADDSDNDPFPSLPAAFDLPNILSVAAIDNTGGLATFSNYGKTTVDIAAPGETILSTLPADAKHPSPGYGWMDGTSMAAPHVSGTAALVASVFPGLLTDPNALKAHILATGKPDAATSVA
jgi:subtilisin family serine protease